MFRCCLILYFVFFAFSCGAKEFVIDDITHEKLQEIYDVYDYDAHLPIKTLTFPPIFLNNMPKGFESISYEPYRNRMFIKILAPIALRVNENIAFERDSFLPMYKNFVENNKDLSDSQKNSIEKLAQKYDIFTRLKDDERYLYLLKELYRRVDAVPPSVMIAASAIETNWGTNRLLREGNSLYKEKVWHTSEGLKSKDDNDDYRYRVFDTLYDAMESFALRLNSGVDFENFRHMRERIRYRRKVMTGNDAAFSLIMMSPIKNFAGLIEYTIAYYELNVIDKCKLDAKMLDKELEERLAKFLRK